MRGGATQLLWAVTVLAAGSLAVEQPWDVGADGKVTLTATATDGSADWPELQRLGVDGVPQVVEGWREHYNSAGELLHVTPASAAPTAAVRSVVVLQSSAARCGLRSWSSADFNAFASDGNGGARRGIWPNDALMSLPCDVTSPSAGLGAAGYTDLVWDTSGVTDVSSVVVDRRDGTVYLGLQAPSTTGSVPAVVAWSSDGQLLGWTRMMPETAAATAPVLEVADLAVDYAANRLVVLARGKRTTDTPRYFWSDPSGNGFFQDIAGGCHSNDCWSSWIAKYDMADGLVLAAATFVAELAAEAAAAGNAGFVDLGGQLAGFADPNQLPASGSLLLGDTYCSHLSVDSSSLTYVACTGLHTATTVDAHHAMWDVAGLGTATGIASRNAFVRVYTSDLSTISFSSLITGEFDTAGVGGDNVDLAAVSPLAGGLVVVASHDAAKQSNSIPTNNATSNWGGVLPQAGGPSGIVGRFSREGLAGWPIETREDCPAGSESELNGMTYSCSICAAGQYSTQINSPECVACALGKYSDSTGATSIDVCIQCPSGYAGASEAATDISQCVECLAGRQSNQATGYLCRDCEPGTYAPEDASDACSNCPQGKYSTTVASVSRDDCIACEAGRYGPDPGIGSLDGCPVCPVGKYGDIAELLACRDCAAGKSSAATQATLESTCVSCTPGQISDAGAGACTPCPVGSFSSNYVSCALCPSGTWSSTLSASSGSSCEDCAPGMYSEAGAESCTTCEESDHSSQVAWGGCFECSATDLTASLPSFAASADAIPFSSLKFGTFPSHASGNLDSFWTGTGNIELDDSVGAVSPGALQLGAGESATAVLPITHTNQAPFVVGGFFAPDEFAAGFATPPTITVTAHWADDERAPLQLSEFELEPPAGVDAAGAGEFPDEDTDTTVVAFTSFEEPIISRAALYVDLHAQNADRQLVATAPTCTGTPAAFLPSGSCTGTATDGTDCATRFEATLGSSESDCTGGDGTGCVYAVDCVARFAQQDGTAETDCIGAEGAGCVYTLHNPVAYSRCDVAPAQELGFRSYYQNHYDVEAGAAAAYSIGVVGDSTTAQAGRLTAQSGSQYFEIRDVDGFVYSTLDTVPVSGYAAAWVELWVHVSAATWETDDFVVRNLSVDHLFSF